MSASASTQFKPNPIGSGKILAVKAREQWCIEQNPTKIKEIYDLSTKFGRDWKEAHFGVDAFFNYGIDCIVDSISSVATPSVSDAQLLEAQKDALESKKKVQELEKKIEAMQELMKQMAKPTPQPTPQPVANTGDDEEDEEEEEKKPAKPTKKGKIPSGKK